MVLTVYLGYPIFKPNGKDKSINAGSCQASRTPEGARFGPALPESFFE